MIAFDPDGGAQHGDNAWVWPCGCAVVVRDAHMVVKVCGPEHDDPLEQFTVGTVSEVRAEIGAPPPEVAYVHPENN